MWYAHGRSDDTLKIAGKRTGPAEIEEAGDLSTLVNPEAVQAIRDARPSSKR
jgi:acetyl-CoA synthetase